MPIGNPVKSVILAVKQSLNASRQGSSRQSSVAFGTNNTGNPYRYVIRGYRYTDSLSTHSLSLLVTPTLNTDAPTTLQPSHSFPALGILRQQQHQRRQSGWQWTAGFLLRLALYWPCRRRPWRHTPCRPNWMSTRTHNVPVPLPNIVNKIVSCTEPTPMEDRALWRTPEPPMLVSPTLEPKMGTCRASSFGFTVPIPITRTTI